MGHVAISPDVSDAIIEAVRNRGYTTRLLDGDITNADYVISEDISIINMAENTDIPGIALYKDKPPVLDPNSGMIPVYFCLQDVMEVFDFWVRTKKSRQNLASRGTEDGQDFTDDINRLVSEYNIESIVESGTFIGLGSTTILARTGLPVDGIECNASHVKNCRNNLKNFSNVTVHHGLSLEREYCKKIILNEPFYGRADRLGLVVDVPPNQTVKFYMQEINSKCPDNLLPMLLQKNHRQLIHLDSAGGLGFAEFQEVIKFKNKLIVFDDIDHVKHFRSMKWCKQNCLKFGFSECKRWGWVYKD